MAVLKTLGFTRRQITAAVAWQVTSFILVAVALGLPLGIAAGRLAWDLVASDINSLSPTLIPALAVAEKSFRAGLRSPQWAAAWDW